MKLCTTTIASTPVITTVSIPDDLSQALPRTRNKIIWPEAVPQTMLTFYTVEFLFHICFKNSVRRYFEDFNRKMNG